MASEEDYMENGIDTRWWGKGNTAAWNKPNPAGLVGQRGINKLFEYPHMNWGIVRKMLGSTAITPGVRAQMDADPFSHGNWLTKWGGNAGRFGLKHYDRYKASSGGGDPRAVLGALTGSRLKIGDNVRSQIQSDIHSNDLTDIVNSLNEASATRLAAEQANWDKQLQAAKDVPIPWNRPAVIAGASGRLQQQGSGVASRRRGKSVKTAWSRQSPGSASGGFWMNVGGARPQGGAAGQQSQLNIA